MATDSQIDEIHQEVDVFLDSGNFEDLDDLLTNLEVEDFDTDECLSYLTATLPARDKLPARWDFFRRCASRIDDLGEMEEGILKGLGNE